MASTAILIHGDTIRTPELRHEVPLGIPDPFVYAEVDGRRLVAISAMEAMRVEALGTGLEVHTLEEFGADELRRSGLDLHAYANELAVRIVARARCRRKRSSRGRFPLGIADALRANGIELTVDQKLFDDRRTVEERARARRHSPRREGGGGGHRGRARAAAPRRARRTAGSPWTASR